MTLNEELDVLIPRYAENKTQMETFKKSVDRDNAKIKELMIGAKNYHYKSDKYKADCTVSTRESINEEKLLEIAHQYGIPEIVKTKEYIDFDMLENAIYNNRIPKDVLLEMDKAKETKEVVTLRVSKIKDKGDDVT